MLVGWFMVFSATFNNISGISWRSVLLVGETGLPGENHRPVQVTDKHYYKRLYRVHLSWAGPEFTTLVVIDTDCTSSCKSNYHTITTTTEWYGRNPNEFVLYCTSCAIIFYFQTSSNLAVSSAKGSYNKEKQSNNVINSVNIVF